VWGMGFQVTCYSSRRRPKQGEGLQNRAEGETPSNLCLPSFNVPATTPAGLQADLSSCFATYEAILLVVASLQSLLLFDRFGANKLMIA
jgi:hypothetical protein